MRDGGDDIHGDWKLHTRDEWRKQKISQAAQLGMETAAPVKPVKNAKCSFRDCAMN
jgi:hypothetical protein